jgi:hypothetical protein
MMDIYKTDGTIETVSDDTDPKTIVGENPKVLRLLDNRFLLSSNEGEPNTHFSSVTATDEGARIISYPYIGDVIFVATLPNDFIKSNRINTLDQSP